MLYKQTHSAICNVLFMAMRKVQCENTVARGTQRKINNRERYLGKNDTILC